LVIIEIALAGDFDARIGPLSRVVSQVDVDMGRGLARGTGSHNSPHVPDLM
jgi:hypothetical protein